MGVIVAWLAELVEERGGCLRIEVARSAARCASQILDRGAQSVARSTARCVSYDALAVASLCIAGN